MKVVALAGGVGGAKLADGLALLTGMSEHLTVIVNTGDDFNHCGLRICPDLDTVCYTLAGMSNSRTGWGIEDETWRAFENLNHLGGPDWFRLGDRDLGTHLERTRRLINGDSLSKITHDFCKVWGVGCTVLPMSNEAVATQIESEELGWLSFQEYFVKYGCKPKVNRFRFEGIETAKPAPGVLESIFDADLIVVCPSNPFVSIAPIISIQGIVEALKSKPVVIAVSPIVGGKAIKGPAAKMFVEFGRTPSPVAVADEYKGWINAIVIDLKDDLHSEAIRTLGLAVKIANTIMVNRPDRKKLAETIMTFFSEIINRGVLE
jgi:LPPG:FO 2-phospho-L-lactate transferase